MSEKKLTSLNKLSVACLVLFTISIYYTSLFHIARSDQVTYLAYFANHDTFFDLVINAQDYNRKPDVLGAIDKITYRPLTFMFLGLQRWLFGYDFLYWQLTSLVLHLAVIWQLYKLLYSIHPSIFAFLLTLFFASLCITMEMVIWHHLSGFLLFIFISLIILNILYRIQQTQKLERQTLFLLFLYFLMECFLLELGMIFTFLFAVFIYIKTNEKKSLRLKKFLFLMFPCALYLMSNLVNYQLTCAGVDSIAELPYAFNVGLTIKNTFFAFLWWILAALFPYLLKIETVQRMVVFAQHFRNYGLNVNILNSLLLCLLLYFCFKIYMHSINRKHLIKNRMFLFLTGCLSISTLLILSAARVNSRGFMTQISHNPYYSYYFWVYFIIFLYALVNFPAVSAMKNKRIIKILSIVILTLLILFNGACVAKQNLKRMLVHQQRYILFVKLNQLIKSHKSNNEPFSFRIDSELFNKPFSWLVKKDGKNKQNYTYFKLFYPKYYNETDPKYIFFDKGTELYYITR